MEDMRYIVRYSACGGIAALFRTEYGQAELADPCILVRASHKKWFYKERLQLTNQLLCAVWFFLIFIIITLFLLLNFFVLYYVVAALSC